MSLRTLALAALAAASLVPAAASAQGYGYGPPPPRPQFVDRGFGYGDPLQAREDHLRDWMRRGSQEGWLTGWRAQRAWGELRAIREEGAGGWDRHDAWSRLDRLGDFVRRAHDDADY